MNGKVQIGKPIKVWQRKLRYYRDTFCRERKAGRATYRIAEWSLIRKKSNKLRLFLVFCDTHMGLSLGSRECDDFTIWLHSRCRSEWLGWPLFSLARQTARLFGKRPDRREFSLDSRGALITAYY
jgi:hypothetical protein